MGPIRTRRLEAAEWAVFRDVRLRALRGAPEAYGTTADEAEGLGEDEWRRRLAARVAFVALQGPAVIGLACGVPGVQPTQAELTSMWVEPDWRRRGVGGSLVQAVAGWAAESGYASLRLWVADGNRAAEGLYASLEFQPTGEVKSMGAGTSSRLEFAMRRELRRARLGGRFTQVDRDRGQDESDRNQHRQQGGPRG